MKNKIIAVIVVIIILVAGILVANKLHQNTPSNNNTQNNINNNSSNTATTTSVDQTVSDGIITFRFPSNEFGLATNKEQILVKSYIPPCLLDFNYCLYFIGKKYQGTNLESAGLRISKRSDINTERLCLKTPPTGFNSSVEPDASTSTDAYSSSVFGNISDAATGHYSNGALYRLYVRDSSSCYEFEARIGQSRFENYPEGSIEKFTTAMQNDLKSSLDNIVNNISINGGKNHLFP